MVYWPWFVASVLACCIGMYVFLRYQTPVYNVTSSVLIKEDEKKGLTPPAAWLRYRTSACSR